MSDEREKAIEAAAKAAWLKAQMTSPEVMPWEEVQPKAKQARIDLYRTAIDAYEAALWQPIETAPKDGTEIDAGLMQDGKFRRIPNARWWIEGNRWTSTWRTTSGFSPFATGLFPTHWRPLPAPPPEQTP